MRQLIIIILCLFSSKIFSQFEKVPDPLSSTNPTFPLIHKELPIVGESFTDLRFGTTITRTTEVNYINGRHEYSRFDPFNKDKSLIILDPDALWNIYSTDSYPYNHLDNLIMTINLEEPRWDVDDKNLLWGTEEFTVQRLDVSSGQTTVIKDFSVDPLIGPIISGGNVYRITMMDEGESSIDKRYWTFFLQGNEQVEYNQLYIFTWDRVDDSVLGLYKIAENEINLDWIGMSPLGNWVLIGGDYDNGGNLAGLTMANKELTQFHRLDYTTAHSDIGLDIHGNEIIIMQNTMTDHIDLIPIDLDTQPILEAGGSYEGTNRTPIVRLFYSNESPNGLNSGIHLSCNTPGYCLISTYIEPGLGEQNWLDRTIILLTIDVDNPQAYYLAKVYGTTGSYWEETHATISNDGLKIVWVSNWNQNVGSEQVFLMQLDMPSNWKDLVDINYNKKKKIINGLQLNQNYPNPFNPTTTIGYSISTVPSLQLKVFDLLGREVATLLDAKLKPGNYEIDWNPTEQSSGIYLYRLYAGEYIETKKMIYLK